MNQTAPQPPLVLIGGWGVDAAMLLPLFQLWPGKMHLISLADEVMSRCESVADAAACLLERYPGPSVWAGWSQGSQIAMAAASSGGPQVDRVITLAGFPRFVAGPDWSAGMAAEAFASFRDGVVSDPPLAWRRFQHLLIHGSDDPLQARKDLLPWLKQGASVSPDNLLRGLDWLESENQQSLWQSAGVPALHVQAGQDAVVGPWAETFATADTSEVITIPGMSHWPRGRAIRSCRDEIHYFVSGKRES